MFEVNKKNSTEKATVSFRYQFTIISNEILGKSYFQAESWKTLLVSLVYNVKKKRTFLPIQQFYIAYKTIYYFKKH